MIRLDLPLKLRRSSSALNFLCLGRFRSLVVGGAVDYLGMCRDCFQPVLLGRKVHTFRVVTTCLCI